MSEGKEEKLFVWDVSKIDFLPCIGRTGRRGKKATKIEKKRSAKKNLSRDGLSQHACLTRDSTAVYAPRAERRLRMRRIPIPSIKDVAV